MECYNPYGLDAAAATDKTCSLADIDEEIQELRDQLEEEMEYSTEMYECAQLAEADLTTLRASMATSQVAPSRSASWFLDHIESQEAAQEGTGHQDLSRAPFWRELPLKVGWAVRHLRALAAALASG